MSKVTIDGIEYAPKADIPDLCDERMIEALKILTSGMYFNQSHKYRAHMYQVMHCLAPELAAVANNSPVDAYERIHGTGD